MTAKGANAVARWVVEHSFGWINRFRRLARDYERLPEMHFVVFVTFTHESCRPVFFLKVHNTLKIVFMPALHNVIRFVARVIIEPL